MLAQGAQQRVGVAAGRGRAVVEGQQELAVGQFAAVDLLRRVGVDLAAGAREQRRQAQLFVEVDAVEARGVGAPGGELGLRRGAEVRRQRAQRGGIAGRRAERLARLRGARRSGSCRSGAATSARGSCRRWRDRPA
nr:hypothetical protein [Lysobacter enzymogenes]